MKKLVSVGLILALLLPSQGCATLKNTKVPQAFTDVGVCSQCKKYIALDGLSDDESAVCPECDATFRVKDARLGFKRLIISRKNQKTAQGVLTVTWMAATFAAAFYGIPLPPPPITEDTFSPYRAPFRIRCKKAVKAGEMPLSYTDAEGCQSLYISARLPNPYETSRSPYSLVITDLYANDGFEPYSVSRITMRRIAEDPPDFAGNAMLGMKN